MRFSKLLGGAGKHVLAHKDQLQSTPRVVCLVDMEICVMMMLVKHTIQGRRAHTHSIFWLITTAHASACSEVH